MEMETKPGRIMKERSPSQDQASGRNGFFELSKRPTRFRKELIRTGTYPHPTPADGGAERTFVVDRTRLEGWVSAFRHSGTKVWVPHRHSMDTRDNAGWVEELFIEDDALCAVLRITDAETAERIRQGTIADVSLGIEFDFTDSEGRTWPEFIRHVALTVDPHIAGQGPFIELSHREMIMNLENENGRDEVGIGEDPAPASGGAGKVDKARYAYWDEESGIGYFIIYDEQGNLLIDEVIEALETLPKLGLGERLAKDIKLALLSALWEAGELPPAKAGEKPEEEPGDKIDEATEMTRRSLADWQARLEALLAEGRITPATARKLYPLLEGFSLPSLQLEAGGSDAVSAVLEALEELPRIVDFSRHTRLGESHLPPIGGEMTDLEREMLAKLGIEEEAYLRYRTND